MRSFFATLRQLVIPAGAQPGTSRIVITPDLPPPLKTYMFGGLDLADGGIIMYTASPGDNTYQFIVHVPNATLSSIYMGSVVAGVVIDDGSNNPAGLEYAVNLATLIVTWALSVDVLNYATGTDLQYASVSMGRGRRDAVAVVANSGAIGAEAVLITGNSVTFFNGRAYRIRVRLNVTLAAANAANAQVIRVRVTNIAGTVENTWVQRCVVAGSESVEFAFIARRTAGTDLTTQLVVTGQGVTNTFVLDVAGNTPGELHIEDIGAAADFTNFNVLV